MGTTDPRIDAYIAKAAPFAQPILTQLREVVHAACPEVEETMKWSSPHFMYKGMLCGMAAFKAHATFGFWKGSLIVEAGKASDDGMGQFGRLTSVKDLPSRKVLAGYVKAAMRLNEEGVQPPREKKAAKPVVVPSYFKAALETNGKAKAAFAAFSPSHKREYLEWITEAKTEPTRERRIAQALAWMSSGKGRNWQYETKKR